VAQPHREACDNNDDGANHRELFLSGSAPPQVELLSIIRVNKASSTTDLDKNLYPYARSDRTCIVSTNDTQHPTIVLEARSSQERDWLVFSLKLIVARLASIIITRDEDMLHEFFSPYSALMQLEADEEGFSSSEDDSTNRVRGAMAHEEDHGDPVIECAVTTRTRPRKAVVVMDKGAGNDELVYDNEANEEPEDATTDSRIFVDEDDLGNDIGDDDEEERGYQHQDMEDSIRARNSGAYAILKRSLTATGPLMDEDLQDDHVVRTFSL